MLARAKGIYHERPINGPLGVYFESLYSHRLPNSSLAEFVIVPDGTLLISNGSMEIFALPAQTVDRKPRHSLLAQRLLDFGLDRRVLLHGLACPHLNF